ncbi:MAG: TetR family transcriptional regulator [Propionibacteriaceae bacterium]|nr:TetR family transcriptional regulator [Propionibacteriaceae bacterium]
MARASREEAEATGRRILAAAREAFATEGYARVRLVEVAAAAGVTRGAVYHRYRVKEDLFADVLAIVMAEVAEAVERAADGAGGLRGGIEAGCLAFVRAATDPGVQRIMLVDGPAVVGWEAWRALDAQHSRHGLEVGLRELEKAGQFRGDPQAAAILLSGALNEAALWVASASDPDSAMDALGGAVRALLAGLIASE